MIPDHLQPPSTPDDKAFEEELLKAMLEPIDTHEATSPILRCFQVPGVHAEGCRLHVPDA